MKTVTEAVRSVPLRSLLTGFLPAAAAFLLSGAALDGLWRLYSGNPFAILGVGAMFLMIGAGVYELTAANGEKKPIKELLKEGFPARAGVRRMAQKGKKNAVTRNV